MDDVKEKAVIDQGVEPGFRYQDLCITRSILNIDKFFYQSLN